MKEPEPMREIHAIREKIYEEQKGLSRGERIKRIQEKANALIKQYGLKFKEDIDKVA